MRDEYQALHDAQWAAESTREQRAEAFREPLVAAAAAVRRRVLDLQLVVQHEKLLDPRTAVSEAQEFAVSLMAQAADVGADAAHVQRQQALFAHEVTAFEELDAVRSDVELKELLWRSRGEVAAQMEECEGGAVTEVRMRTRRCLPDRFTKTVLLTCVYIVSASASFMIRFAFGFVLDSAGGGAAVPPSRRICAYVWLLVP